MYKLYYEDDQDHFNCRLNWKARNAVGTYGKRVLAEQE